MQFKRALLLWGTVLLAAVPIHAEMIPYSSVSLETRPVSSGFDTALASRMGSLEENNVFLNTISLPAADLRIRGVSLRDPGQVSAPGLPRHLDPMVPFSKAAPATSVPEPGAFFLVLLGLTAVVLFGRRLPELTTTV
jgi:hypothetical protein